MNLIPTLWEVESDTVNYDERGQYVHGETLDVAGVELDVSCSDLAVMELGQGKLAVEVYWRQ